jgi:alpha-L-fucosidase
MAIDCDKLACRAAQVVPSERQLAWHKMELTAFIHFTVNTFTDKEWGDGSESPNIFNPVQCDPRQWVRELKAAGFKMIILTTKHHDGFCLWPSKYTEHSIKNSPYKNGSANIVKDFVDACNEYGVKPGFYLSPWDRHEKSYGDSPLYNEYFLNQLRELCSDYGKIYCFWFDGACAEGPNGKVQEYDWNAYYALIRELQPQAMISDIGPDARWCGNEAGRGRDAEWSVVNMNKSVLEFNHENCTCEDIGSLDALGAGENLIWHPSEVDTSNRPGWFWHESENDQVKPVAELFNIYVNSIGGNAVLLLNFPPDTRGLLHEKDVAVLKEFRQYLDESFKDNLVKNAEVSVENIADGDYDSYWIAEEGQKTAEIIFNLHEEKTFNCIVMQEYIPVGQRISEFTVEAEINNSWQEVANGQTVGYKKILVFDDTTASKIKLSIRDSRLCPSLNNFELYKIQKLDGGQGEDSGSDRSLWKVVSGSGLPEHEVEKLFDGLDYTTWQSDSALPCEIIVDMGESKEIQGFSFLPPQETYQGHILKYELSFGNTLVDLDKAIVGEFTNTVNNPIRQFINLDEAQTLRYFKLKVISCVNDYKTAILTDIDIVEK